MVRITEDRPESGARFSPLLDLAGRTCGYLEILVPSDDRDVDREMPDSTDSDSAKIDPAVLDSDGPPGWLSLSWTDGAVLPFDDVAVSGAVRARLRSGHAAFMSTRTRGDDTLAGAVTGVTGCTAEQAVVLLRDDPFARLFPRRLVSYGPGIFGPNPPPAGPATQRYGAATPWPSDRF
ncbi:hypothetical protein [Sporichthya sp.]|uniref:hypothetical protein n=1 Tax=Sporichthya sp. TaxID=65475 RepID=UPI0017FAEB34|nr:hypothetical protein [Sporichthya sp.]MBA3743217.1 hypothetical protein [Sporichthya sp.]